MAYTSSPFAGAQIDFSKLSGVPGDLADVMRANKLHSVFSNGLPMKDGVVDFDQAANILAGKGFTEEALKVGTLASKNNSNNKVFGQPVYYQENPNDPKSPIKLGTWDKNGKFVPINTGNSKVLPPYKLADQETQLTPLGPGGVPLGPPLPKNVYDKSQQQELGKTNAENTSALPTLEQNVDTGVEAIDRAIQHPGRERRTGMSSWGDPRNYLAGTQGVDYETSAFKQVQGTGFLVSIQQMRGLGQLSDAEGRAATAAQTGLALEQTDEGHLQSLRVLKALMLRGKIRGYVKAGKEPPLAAMNAWRKAEAEAGRIVDDSGKILSPDEPVTDMPQPQGQDSPAPSSGARIIRKLD